MDYKLNLDWQSFLESHWQKTPFINKTASRFVDPLSPDELAGLAMEDEVDSRLVSCQDGQGSQTGLLSTLKDLVIKIGLYL